uniref:uncharacterized protein C15orf65-like n=1 Tax=Styela clava TaxID=7725 RepID=UPI00193A9A06|nr:uncharacterized protein C15orf65-like [Styela clava]
MEGQTENNPTNAEPGVLNPPGFPTSAQEALESVKSVPCSNTGNPVFSCMSRVEVERDEMAWDGSYQPQHPLYKTSSSIYGILPATHESAPTTFHGKSQRFSQHLGVCGMYRNHSLNTWTDKSKVYDSPRM